MQYHAADGLEAWVRNNYDAWGELPRQFITSLFCAS